MTDLEQVAAWRTFEARDTLRLQLTGKIDEWFAKADGSGAVFLMNVTDPAEAHRLLEQLPLGQDL